MLETDKVGPVHYIEPKPRMIVLERRPESV